ncbi:MAG: 1-acyl-sn-glycerol-3-phosphate acyltransferase [Anaerolineales bacterium]|nr:1-acyl-sn-glycerol-3-phosphate acyltransferase [Anaerolineales bacterium]
MPSQLDTLTQINLDDLVSSFGWEKYPLLATPLRFLFANPARKFAEQMVEFDNAVGHANLAEASRTLMRKLYVRDVRVHGHENISQDEPALFLSNHPGMADTISLFAAINRPDLNIIALHRPFLVSLTNVTRNLAYISDEDAERMRAVRQISSHLKKGGAALTFPAGKIEPDPSVYPGAFDSLSNWTDSAGVFIRFARETKIVPVLVSGVVWEKTAHHWLTHIKRTRFEREKLAAALQLLAMVTRNARPTTVHVQFAKPITLDEVGSTDAEAIHQVVLERMKRLIETTPKDDGMSAL